MACLPAHPYAQANKPSWHYTEPWSATVCPGGSKARFMPVTSSAVLAESLLYCFLELLLGDLPWMFQPGTAAEEAAAIEEDCALDDAAGTTVAGAEKAVYQLVQQACAFNAL
jgi:hypothetical protein